MADYLFQPSDYLLQIASFLLLCLIEYHSNLLLKDENRVTNGAQNYCNWVGLEMAIYSYISICFVSFLYEKIKITPVFMAPLLSLWC